MSGTGRGSLLMEGCGLGGSPTKRAPLGCPAGGRVASVAAGSRVQFLVTWLSPGCSPSQGSFPKGNITAVADALQSFPFANSRHILPPVSKPRGTKRKEIRQPLSKQLHFESAGHRSRRLSTHARPHLRLPAAFSTSYAGLGYSCFSRLVLICMSRWLVTVSGIKYF